MPADLRVALGALPLANPVIAAAGTFGYGLEFQGAMPVRRLGAIITKTVTARARDGNPPPRLVETPAGMLNAVGLQNVGLDAFLEEKVPKLGALGVPIIASLMAETLEEARAMAERLDRAAPIAAVELNLSCPNITHGHRRGMVAQDAEATREFVSAARQALRKPLIAKLSPDVTDPRPIAEAAAAAGADALSLVNTFTGMSLDPRTRRSRIGSLTGGVSGPAIRPLAVYRVWLVRQVVSIPIIGLGGILRAEDAIEFLLAGATAVAVGTATFADPKAAARVVDGLQKFADRQGLRRIDELIGAIEDGRQHAVATG